MTETTVTTENTTDVSSAQARLKNFASRINNVEEEIEARVEDIKEIFKEAKDEGFDTKILRKALKLLKMDRTKREEERELVDLYVSRIEE